jgi:hypothetical protein
MGLYGAGKMADAAGMVAIASTTTSNSTSTTTSNINKAQQVAQ